MRLTREKKNSAIENKLIKNMKIENEFKNREKNLLSIREKRKNHRQKVEREIKKYRQREKHPRSVKTRKSNHSEVECLGTHSMHPRDRLKRKVKKR